MTSINPSIQRAEFLTAIAVIASSGFIYDRFGVAWTAFTIFLGGFLLLLDGIQDNQ